MGKRGLDPVASERTTGAARRGRSLLESLVARFPSLFAPLASLALGMPKGRLRATLLRHAIRRAYAAFNRRDWEINTLGLDPDRYVFVNTDDSRDMIGMASIEGVEGYIAAMERWHDGWDVVRVCLAPEQEIIDVRPGSLLTIDCWQGRVDRTGMSLDLEMATLYEFQRGRVIRQTIYWEVDRALAEHGLTRR